jgi:hypothetical protein
VKEDVIMEVVHEYIETKSESDEAELDRAIQTLIGAVPYTEMSLSELRKERLKKYEIVDLRLEQIQRTATNH